MAKIKYLDYYNKGDLTWQQVTQYNQKQREKYLKIYKRWFRIKDIEKFASYDGGNDSGNIEFYQNIPHQDMFYDILMNTVLDEYGSWAGDYNAYGKLLYNRKTNEFEAYGQESTYIDVFHNA